LAPRAATARFFRGARRDTGKAALNPFAHCRVGPIALRADTNEAGHCPRAHLHRPDVWLVEHLSIRRGHDTNQDAAPPADGATHAAAHHETQAAHHLALKDVASPGKRLAHA